MHRFLVTLVFAASYSVLLASASAQPAVERLERQLRDRQKANDDKPDDTGYLGVVADDRAAGARGVELMEIMAGSPAAKGGLEVGDLMLKIGDKPIRNLDDFAAALQDQSVGKTLRFAIERKGQPMQVEATLATRPPKGARRFPTFGRVDDATDEPPRMSLLGVRVEPVDPQAADAAGVPEAQGAYVVSVAPDSPAALAGIPTFAVIVGFDDQEVREPADLKQVIASSRPGQQVKVDYYSRGKLFEKQVRLAEVRPDEGVAPLDAPIDRPPLAARAPSGDRERIEQLERRVQELEARLAEMEQFLRGK
ncbi:MAG TPA: PDZ domain-containing protein [Pirellulales bacterium]|jgi:S1-C subfamily serine protease|nr:PDZ domain-containing protein [Pirellulales bacterium]